MYSPQYAIETDKNKINQVISDNSFATIIYQEDGLPQSFHLPLMLDGDKLIGHMAKANPAWRVLNGNPALIIFHGPHCYISPDWYGTNHNVPTWNYISVQVRGKVEVCHDGAFLERALTLLSKKYDPGFDIKKNVEDNSKLLNSIVGIEILIEEVFAKFKLAQSKPVAERENVINVLKNSSHSQDKAIAKAMQETLK